VTRFLYFTIFLGFYADSSTLDESSERDDLQINQRDIVCPTISSAVSSITTSTLFISPQPRLASHRNEETTTAPLCNLDKCSSFHSYNFAHNESYYPAESSTSKRTCEANALMHYECVDDNCSLDSASCKNRRIQRAHGISVEIIKMVNSARLALIPKVVVPPNSYVGEYCGEVRNEQHLN
jgi:hypothetical protein